MAQKELIQTADNTFEAIEVAAQPFTVYRDGEPDPEWVREQRIEYVKHIASTALHGSVSVIRAAVAPIKAVGHELLTNIELDAYDAKYKTNYAKQYHEQKRKQRNAQFAARVGLLQ